MRKDLVNKLTIVSLVSLLSFVSCGVGWNRVIEEGMQGKPKSKDPITLDYRYFAPENLQGMYDHILKSKNAGVDSLAGGIDFSSSFSKLLTNRDIGSYLGDSVRFLNSYNPTGEISGSDMVDLSASLASNYGIPWGLFIYDGPGKTGPQTGLFLPSTHIKFALLKQKSGPEVRLSGDGVDYVPLVFSPSESYTANRILVDAVTRGAWKFSGVKEVNGVRTSHPPKEIILDGVNYGFNNGVYSNGKDTLDLNLK